jgi:hypothetical protein
MVSAVAPLDGQEAAVKFRVSFLPFTAVAAILTWTYPCTAASGQAVVERVIDDGSAAADMKCLS